MEKFIIIKVNKDGMTTEKLVDASKRVKDILGIDILFLSREADYIGFFDGEKFIPKQEPIIVQPTPQIPYPTNPFQPNPTYPWWGPSDVPFIPAWLMPLTVSSTDSNKTDTNEEETK